MAQLNLTGKLFSIYLNYDKPTELPLNLGDVFQADGLSRWYVHFSDVAIYQYNKSNKGELKADRMFSNYDKMVKELNDTFGKVNFR